MTKHLVAIMTMLVGAGTILATLVAMNAAEFSREEVKPRQEVAFERKAPKKKKKKKRAEKVRKKRRVTPNAPPPPAPMLGVELGGVDLGLGGGIGDVSLSQDALAARPRATVMTEDAVDRKPKAARRTAASYPKRARAKGVEGFVKFSLLIDESGRVSRLKVLESQPPGTFDDAAKQAIRQWSFQPAMYQGAPVKVWATQTLRFKLQ